MTNLPKPVQFLQSISRTLYRRRRTSSAVTVAALVGEESAVWPWAIWWETGAAGLEKPRAAAVAR